MCLQPFPEALLANIRRVPASQTADRDVDCFTQVQGIEVLNAAKRRVAEMAVSAQNIEAIPPDKLRYQREGLGTADPLVVGLQWPAAARSRVAADCAVDFDWIQYNSP